MSATAEIQVESRKGVVLLPIEAIQERNGEKYVIIAPSSLQDKSGDGEVTGKRQTSEGATARNRNRVWGSLVTGDGRGTQSGNFFGRFSFRKVEVGLTNETYAEIISGVEEGEEVIIPLSSTVSTPNNWRDMFPGFGGMRNGGFDRSRVPANIRR